MKYILTFACFFITFLESKAQSPVLNCTVLNNNSTSSPESSCNITFADFLNTADITIQVNFHVMSSTKFSSTTVATNAVKTLLKDMNERLLNFDYYRVNNTIQAAAFVPRSKIKCKLYSESSNTNDLYGGIWLYPANTDESDYTDKYNGKTLNIILESSNTDDFTGVSGLGTGGNSFVVRDFYAKRNDPIAYFSITTVHELGHRLGLHHPEYCNNECAGIDIDASNECNSRCPQVNTCSPTLIYNNGGDATCNGITQKLCNSCDRSNLLTSACFTLAYRKAMTPCQWETIFNDVSTNKPLYGLLCSTASTFTLSTSPLNDYRASQSITSTSVINGDRIVDYWAPTITLNGGFNVELGTTFIAGPSSFPCCSGGVAYPESTNNNNPITALPNLLEVVPNPFGDNIQVNYHIDTDFEKVSLNIADMTGRIVKNIPIDAQIKGQYQIGVKTNDLPNGVYFIQLQSKGRTATQKIIKANKN